MQRTDGITRDIRVTGDQGGFTLLEIMVVVVLIALTVTLVGMNLGRDTDQIAQLEATRFARLLSQVRDESVLTGKSYAIELNEQNNSYRFLRSTGEWQPIIDDDLFRSRRFPEFLEIRLDVFSKQENDPAGLLIVQNLGEITPFRLVVTGETISHVVELDESFNIQIEQVDRDAT